MYMGPTITTTSYGKCSITTAYVRTCVSYVRYLRMYICRYVLLIKGCVLLIPYEIVTTGRVLLIPYEIITKGRVISNSLRNPY